jgi:hypothetical protein
MSLVTRVIASFYKITALLVPRSLQRSSNAFLSIILDRIAAFFCICSTLVQHIIFHAPNQSAVRRLWQGLAAGALRCGQGKMLSVHQQLATGTT